MNYKEEFNLLIDNYKNRVELEFTDRWNNWNKELKDIEVYEVVGGILARQISIGFGFIESRASWNENVAPIIMRSMIDNYINFAWILQDPLERSKRFIYFGLGQEKLIVEHRKKDMESRDNLPNEKMMIEHSENWINAHRYTFLTEVSFKTWSEKTVRQMAEESDCIDLYNYAYSPFSCATHNMWNHIAKYNLIESNNPLHRNFKIPIVHIIQPSIHYLELSAKYIDKMLERFDKVFKYNGKTENSYEYLLKELDLFEEQANNFFNSENDNKNEE